ncbi:MAG: bifunctional UDP-N-acetylglucosamine diphosphorylase/glucosamine-1-phosphate N-acetyltransferase GlmU [Myxococcales bacterium]|nr:bifunctional UDP-N-acetylglucosamine diphosphorylase/glucosamine-1-phosphate N-acetyltransferase GlmU [Myxococcales bacterium]
MLQDTIAIVLAAGAGTRMKSAVAKPLHPILGLPLSVYPALAALEAGVRRIVVVVGHQRDEVKAALSALLPPDRVDFAVQADPRGTGDAVVAASPYIHNAGYVLILNGDVPGIETSTLTTLAAATQQAQALVGLVTCRLNHPRTYGRIVRGHDGAVIRIVEDKDATEEQRLIHEVNVGIYLADSTHTLDTLRRTGTNNAQGELYLTAIVDEAARLDRPPVTVMVPEGLNTWGINDRSELARVEDAMRARINDHWMRSGVTMHNPASIFIETNVSLGTDTELGPNVRLAGRTTIGNNCKIDQGCVITNSQIEGSVHVKPYSIITETHVGPAAEIGPFAHLRPGTTLGERTKIGNFVETKKAKLHTGAKANHLAYLGDCDIGQETNIGAGTITCNYDGKHKYQTTIESHVFIGSDTQLVAPVHVGKGAYVGAGTTVTQDVPAGALAISRTPQKNIEGWVARKKG